VSYGPPSSTPLLTFILIETLYYSHIVFHFMHIIAFIMHLLCNQLGICESGKIEQLPHLVCAGFVSCQQDEGRRIKVQALRDRTFMEIPDEEIFTGLLEN
jgi:hypothetical protein